MSQFQGPSPSSPEPVPTGQADDYGLVDVNHTAAAGLQQIPGVTAALAGRIVDQRGQCGGYSSIEDLGLMLDLPPDAVDQMREVAVFIPG